MATIKATPLKQGMMSKRAQGKSALGRVNWTDRFFVLDKSELSYWDKFGGAAAHASKKGCIDLRTIAAVETVGEEAFGKQFMFQICYDDSGIPRTLYTQSSDNMDREEWVKAIRQQIAQNPSLSKRFHPGAYVDGKWTCCGELNKLKEGCQECYQYGSISPNSSSSPTKFTGVPATLTNLPLPTIPGGGLGRIAGSSHDTQPPSMHHPANPTLLSNPVSPTSAVLPLPTSPEPAQNSVGPPVCFLRHSFCLRSHDLAVQQSTDFEVTAMYAYTAVEAHDLTIKENENLTIIEVSSERGRKNVGVCVCVMKRKPKRVSRQETTHKERGEGACE